MPNDSTLSFVSSWKEMSVRGRGGGCIGRGAPGSGGVLLTSFVVSQERDLISRLFL